MSEQIDITITDATETITVRINEAARGATGASVTVDQTIIDGSTNAVSGNAVFDGLALKAPTANPTFTGIVTAPRITGRCDGLEVFCKAGLAINAGQVVYVTGAAGNNIIIGLAQANTEPTSSKTIGISESTLALNATGYAITEGLLTVSISAPSAVEGDPIWLSPTTAGGMVFGSANKPSAPNHIVYLGVVTRKTGNTVVEIYVKIQNGAELDELADVAITSPAAGQALMRGASLWENRSLVSADISDASEGGNESSDAAKLVKYKSDGSIFASTFVRASLPSNGNAYAQLQSAGTDSGLVLYKSATASATIANSSVTGDRVLQSPDLSGTIALTSDSRFTDERVPTAAGLTSKFGTNKATVVDADKVAILDSAASDAPKHSTFSAIWTWIQSKFAAASSKTTPIDADSFNIVDSADSNAAKRVTGTNLKAYLKTYLDTLYVARTGTQTVAGDKTFSGQVDFSTMPKVSAYKSTDQTGLTAGAYNKITFDTEVYDVGSNFASSTFTAPYACKVLINATIFTSGVSDSVALAVYKNGTQHKRIAAQDITTAANTIVDGSVVIDCATSDTIEIYLYTLNGRSVLGAATITHVQFTALP